MPADTLTLITAAIFATALLVFAALALLLSSTVGSERRRWRRRLQRAAGFAERDEDRAAQEFMRSVRRMAPGTRRTPPHLIISARATSSISRMAGGPPMLRMVCQHRRVFLACVCLLREMKTISSMGSGLLPRSFVPCSFASS